MRIIVDTNVAARAVRQLRAQGHDVVYLGERASDPGDEALLMEAAADARVLLTKDRDVGTLVHRDGQHHSGVLLLDDLGDAGAESDLIAAALSSHGDRLAAGAFVRAGPAGVRVARQRRR